MEKDDYDLKAEYEKARKGRDLPEYKELTDDFDIEKLNEKESSYLLRDIRRILAEKISAYMQLFDTLTNSSSSSLFILSMIKKIDKDVREKINKNYKILSKFQIISMKLDTIYDESAEANFIKEFCAKWQEMKKEIHDLIGSLGKGIEENKEERKGGYFG